MEYQKGGFYGLLNKFLHAYRGKYDLIIFMILRSSAHLFERSSAKCSDIPILGPLGGYHGFLIGGGGRNLSLM